MARAISFNELNEQQRQAVRHGNGALLIVAGAGTGKTRVIVNRLRYLMQARAVAPQRILSVTFSNHAAEEVRRRIVDMVGESANDIAVGTFHWVGQRILRRYGAWLPVGSSFHVLTPQQSLATLRRLCHPHESGASACTPEQLRDAVSLFRNTGRTGPVQTDDIRKVSEQYVSAVRAQGALDIDDLVLEAARLLEDNEGIRRRLQAALDHILVDEYQDVNPAQARLLRLLVPVGGNITAVGDEDQAIYGWRHADVDVMLNFPKTFHPVTVIRLEQNYRSTRRILQPANELLRQNRKRIGKTLESKVKVGRKPTVFGAGDQAEEAQFAIATVRRLLSEGIGASEVAILFRVNTQSRAIEDALIGAGIPYEVQAGRRFYERPEVSRVIDALRVSHEPQSHHAWTALLGRLPGLGPVRSASLADAMVGTGTPFVLADGMIPPAVPGPAVRPLHALLAGLRRGENVETLSDRLRIITSSFETALGPLGSTAAEQEAENANVEEFVAAAAEFEDRTGEGLDSFLDHLALSGPDKQTDGVQLMTLHAAKGLEFDAVIIVGVEEGLLPHTRSSQREDHVEEERRLLYVGMTRARSELFLSYSRTRLFSAHASLGQPSRFLGEMPSHLFQFSHGSGKKPAPRLIRARVGETVRHPRWGTGTIRSVEGRGRDTMISITFRDGSVQRVQLRHAPLERVS